MSIGSSFWQFSGKRKLYVAKMTKSSRLLAAAGFVLLLGTSHIAGATNYFKWDVETNSVNACCGAAGTVTLHSATTYSTATAHSGTRSMLLQITGQGGNEDSGAELSNWNSYSWNIVGGPALYYRWWMKIMPGFNWGDQTQKVKTSRVLGGRVAVGYTGYMWNDGFNIAECNNESVAPGQGCLDVDGQDNQTDSRIKIPYNMNSKADGQWHEYIVMVKPNTSASCTIKVNCDAQFKVWIDGVQIGQLLNWRLQAIANNPMIEAWGTWMVYPYWQLNATGPAGGSIYVDDFSTDDTWNSLISGSPTSGSISAPANLRAL